MITIITTVKLNVNCNAI